MHNKHPHLPRYVCHKQVNASQIVSITPVAGGYDLELNPQGILGAPKTYITKIDPVFVSRYMPVPGDYFVAYDDGYISVSPKATFEEGYTLKNS